MAFLKNIATIHDSDTELLARYKKQGDATVLAALYQRYMELVYGVCLKYLNDHEAARDAVMSIYESLGTKVKQHEVQNFKSWLYTLAKNYCLMQLRTPRNLKTVAIPNDFMQSETDAHLNGMFEREEQFTAMEKCLESLSADQQQSVKLFYLQNKCYKEIAALTGYEWNKVRSLIQNARRNLKGCMEEQLGRKD